MMSFFSAWQPLTSENAQTALAFGYLRHAPPEEALCPWLSEIMGRDLLCEPLELSAFWPTYGSMVDGHQRTTPELVFIAKDATSEVTIVVEAKRLPESHELDQLTREAIDTATAVKSRRLALIM